MGWDIDGAHAGLTANQALRVIVGGEEPPPEAERLTREKMRAWLEGGEATIDVDARYADEPFGELGNQAGEITAEQMEQLRPTGTGSLMAVKHGPAAGVGYSRTYEAVARALGRRFLRLLDAHPEARDKYVECPWITGMPEPFLDDLLEQLGEGYKDLHPTGFQMGWAANAAKWVHGEPPAPNPALASSLTSE